MAHLRRKYKMRMICQVVGKAGDLETASMDSDTGPNPAIKSCYCTVCLTRGQLGLEHMAGYFWQPLCSTSYFIFFVEHTLNTP